MKSSYLTATDQFCGAGGSTLGAKRAGVEIRLAMNHWKVAVDTYNTNHPSTDVECANISLSDPRRYCATDILITSPECTTHSPAGGNQRQAPPEPQLDAFNDDPAFVRSRATAWDVVRFAEVHRYNLIFVENVHEFTKWELFPSWLATMDALGYHHRIVSLNSMFCLPTPQSRDRVYTVFWRKGNRAPNLDVTPRAWCLKCERQVDAVQTWKKGRTVGKYRQQYTYTCPACTTTVTPYYFAALNAIDLTLPAQRIGDRDRELAARTRERVAYGIQKYGRRFLLIRVGYGFDNNHGAADAMGPCLTQTARQEVALLNPGFIIPPFGERAGQAPRVHLLNDAAPVVTTRGPGDLVMPFVVTARRHDTGSSPANPLTTVCSAGNHHMLVQGAALLTLRDHPRMQLRGLDEPAAPQLANGPHDAIISPAPFLLTYDRTNLPSGLDEPTATITTIDRSMLVEPDDAPLPAVDDCYFRMFEPFEIGRAMAFPDDYRVLGTKRERVKQFGNAVTPPAMDLLMRRGIESLHPELAT